MSKNKKHSKRQSRKAKRRSNLAYCPPLPDNFSATLNYTSRSQVSGTAFTVFNFDAIGLQALQPTYRDQLLALYQQYVVFGVTIDVKIVNKSATVDAEVVDYHGDGYTVAALTSAQALEYKHTKRMMCTTTGNKKSLAYTRTVWFKNFLPKNFISDSRFWGTASTAPSYSSDRGYQLAVGFLAADGTSTLSLTMDRRIKFHVRFFTLAPTTLSVFDADNSAENQKPSLQTNAGVVLDSDSDQPEVPKKKPTKPLKKH